jgi:hypothetical protein
MAAAFQRAVKQMVIKEGAWEEKFQEHVKPIATHCTQEDILVMDEMASLIMHYEEYLALTGEKCQGVKEYKDRVMVFLC